ncbi:hypothetical protein ACN27J_12230 [Solwaraspora sp. WMMB762]|uniref:hypothetical protein n=1 Tax=Solwaraspora sp. WMMB762 TaxID=3404120 RepID=UPI003B93F43F
MGRTTQRDDGRRDDGDEDRRGEEQESFVARDRPRPDRSLTQSEPLVDDGQIVLHDGVDYRGGGAGGDDGQQREDAAGLRVLLGTATRPTGEEPPEDHAGQPAGGESDRHPGGLDPAYRDLEPTAAFRLQCLVDVAEGQQPAVLGRGQELGGTLIGVSRVDERAEPPTVGGQPVGYLGVVRAQVRDRVGVVDLVPDLTELGLAVAIDEDPVVPLQRWILDVGGDQFGDGGHLRRAGQRPVGFAEGPGGQRRGHEAAEDRDDDGDGDHEAVARSAQPGPGGVPEHIEDLAGARSPTAGGLGDHQHRVEQFGPAGPRRVGAGE